MGRAGFEPATPGLRVPCSTGLSYRPTSFSIIRQCDVNFAFSERWRDLWATASIAQQLSEVKAQTFHEFNTQLATP